MQKKVTIYNNSNTEWPFSRQCEILQHFPDFFVAIQVMQCYQYTINASAHSLTLWTLHPWAN